MFMMRVIVIVIEVQEKLCVVLLFLKYSNALHA